MLLGNYAQGMYIYTPPSTQVFRDRTDGLGSHASNTELWTRRGKGEETGETSENTVAEKIAFLTGLTGLVDRARFHIEWLFRAANSDWTITVPCDGFQE